MIWVGNNDTLSDTGEEDESDNEEKVPLWQPGKLTHFNLVPTSILK